MIRSHTAPLALLAAALVAPACAPASSHQRAGVTPRSPAVAVDRRIDSLLSLMTLEEKLGQLNLLSVDGDTVTPEQGELIRKGLVGGLLNLTGADATRRVQRLAVEQSRLKVPLIFGYDVIHGYRTTFPIPLAEASSWDPDAVESAARLAARQAAADGGAWTQAPQVAGAGAPRR